VQIVGLKLSKNFGHQKAVLAGLQKSRHSMVAIIDSDMQDPPRTDLFVGTNKVLGAEIPSIRSLFWPTSYTMFYGWKVYSGSCSGKN
jgi:glycosyltransferase involved in cell wall biosynthesis